MTIIACTQDHIAPDECCNCGGWLHVVQRGGFPGPFGKYCTEECAVDAQRHGEEADRRGHLNQRDLLCDCPICTAAGHPTRAELDDYRAYQAGLR